jgi:hypothetical protein
VHILARESTKNTIQQGIDERYTLKATIMMSGLPPFNRRAENEREKRSLFARKEAREKTNT